MDKSVQEEAIRENAGKESVGSCDRCKGEVCSKKGKGIPAVKRRERRSKRVCKGVVAKKIHLAIKVTSNGTSVLRRKEKWEKANGPGL